MTDYALDTAVTLYTVVRDEDGAQVEPESIALRIEDPTHIVDEPEVVPVDGGSLAAAAAALGETLSGTTGVYQAQLTPSMAGTWFWHWQAQAPTIARYGWFQVPWPLVQEEGS